MGQHRSKSLPRKLACVMILCGIAIIVMHESLSEIAYGLTKTDGIYIPHATYTAPANSTGEVMHVFRIYNLQRQPLKLEAEPDCGCTGLSWQKASIAPFRWKDITAKMEVKPQRSQSVTIVFRTNRREKPYLFAFLRS